MAATFDGVHFVLLGPDFASLQTARSKLIRGGGVDVGQYNSRCTHLIVDKVVYDHPVCYAARGDGKPVVTSLWVDHSLEIGGPVDDTMIMYRPLRDLNGIPGAKDLVICLTGYKPPQRGDLLIMISLMGAKISKPLEVEKALSIMLQRDGKTCQPSMARGLVHPASLSQSIRNIIRLRQWCILPEADYVKSLTVHVKWNSYKL